jgi:hypothetical protein
MKLWFEGWNVNPPIGLMNGLAVNQWRADSAANNFEKP